MTCVGVDALKQPYTTSQPQIPPLHARLSVGSFSLLFIFLLKGKKNVATHS